MGIAQITSPPSPQFGQLVPLFLDVKNDVLARITEPSNDDYDNGVSDNCDHNFGTFDDFGVKNDQKVSHNMILMSKYKGQHGGEKGKKIRARPSPPLFSDRKKSIFSLGGVPSVCCTIRRYAPLKAAFNIWFKSAKNGSGTKCLLSLPH